MCGIAGYFGNNTINSDRLNKCMKLMNRRGPDAGKIKKWTNSLNKHIYFLHSRLKIIDLSSDSNQPFFSCNKWITFNGELYNYIELRNKLKILGHNFKTNSDTEVLVKTLSHLGLQGLDMCEGMWAFALYDLDDESIVLCRDRFGEKPLYIFKDIDGIYFGSEIKFILALLGRKIELNLDQIYRFLINGFKSVYKHNCTFYKGLYELQPASVLKINKEGDENTSRYWEPKYLPNIDMTYEDAVNGVRDLLYQSLEIRLRSDVPLAFCMSGGVDSNVLVSIAKKVFNYDVHGFTVIDSDERYNEEILVKEAVKILGIHHTPIKIGSADFLSDLQTLIQQHDGPVLTSSYYAHWLLLNSISSHGYKISISGTAADELFSGYYEHYLAYLYLVRNDSKLYDSSLKDWNDHINPIIRNPYLKDPNIFNNNPDQRDYIYLNAEKFKNYLTFQWDENFRELSFTSDILRNRMLNEMFYEIVPPILHQDDLNSMFYSVENRSPYLDKNLFEFSYQIPSKYLIQNGYNKIILRDAMRDIVPESILNNRNKIGFNASINSLIDLKDHTVRSKILSDSPILDFVDREKMAELIGKDNMPNSESKFLFNFLSLKLFMEDYL